LLSSGVMPDAGNVQESKGENGLPARSMKQFACRYFHEGSWWGINLSAYDWADAEARAKKLGVQLDEEIGTIGADVAVRLWTIIKNLTSPRGR